MRARVGLLVVIAAATAWAGDPKPKPVDVTAFRDRLIVLEDASGGTYVVLPEAGNSRIWYGTGKTLYEQITTSYSADGDSWMVSVWAPRVANFQPGSVQKKDGAFRRWCGGDSDLPLKPVPADRVKTVLAHVSIMSPAALRVPYLLARDDTGIYYYVDKLRGATSYRVFSGKKGAMKQLPLSDLATDPAGDVFATPNGEMRFVHDAGEKPTATWVHGSERRPLSLVDTDAASRMIFKDLGIYTFLGTLCDES
jgi:hypothetical protein